MGKKAAARAALRAAEQAAAAEMAAARRVLETSSTLTAASSSAEAEAAAAATRVQAIQRGRKARKEAAAAKAVEEAAAAKAAELHVTLRRQPGEAFGLGLDFDETGEFVTIETLGAVGLHRSRFGPCILSGIVGVARTVGSPRTGDRTGGVGSFAVTPVLRTLMTCIPCLSRASDGDREENRL